MYHHGDGRELVAEHLAEVKPERGSGCSGVSRVRLRRVGVVRLARVARGDLYHWLDGEVLGGSARVELELERKREGMGGPWGRLGGGGAVRVARGQGGGLK